MDSVTWRQPVLQILRQRRWVACAGCALLILAVALACARSKRPTLTLTPNQAQPGAVIQVLGRNWPAGKRVTIVIQGDASAEMPVADELVDGSGTFAGVFLCPSEADWRGASQLDVTAHTADRTLLARAVLQRASALSTAPAPTLTVPASPSDGYALGNVKVIGADAVTIEPVEGTARVVRVTNETEFLNGGLTDLHAGDLIEAYGRAEAGDILMASWLRIVQSSRPASTRTPTATPSPTGPAPITWQGDYYDNTTFAGSPRVRRQDAVIDFQWSDTEAAEGVPADAFAVRWTGSWPFDTGTYRFYAQVNDGVRLWLDSHLIIDRWHQSTGALYMADARLSAGPHHLKIEYFDGTGDAHAKVWWEFLGDDVDPSYNHWKADYYANATLTGEPVLTVNERAIDLNWGTGAPSPGMPADNFGVRWTRAVDLAQGIYRFRVRADDGVRLYVDGKLSIDEWHDSAPREYTADIELTAGTHTLQLDYYEHNGGALVSLSWELVPATPTPTATLSPSPQPTATRSATLTASSTARPPLQRPRTRTPRPRPATPTPRPKKSPVALRDWINTLLRKPVSGQRQKHLTRVAR